jgi:23S rRNA (adenine1618-N6)-methyltransferase
MTAPRPPKPARKKPSPATPAKAVEPREKASLHPRNRHQGRYDFPTLIKSAPELKKFVIINPYGKESIDFASPEAVRVFNRALLKSFYGIAHWDIPADYLCPPVPGRADYVHFLADLLASGNDGVIPRGAAVKVLDIGMGANCVYPLIGYSDYRWQFLGSDIDATAIAAAKAIIQSNGLNKAIQVRQQSNPKQILTGLLESAERFDLSMCNPPFHASLDEATRGSTRKWRALGKADPKRKLPVLNFGGQAAELWCEGGEVRFVTQLVSESVQVAQQVLWFSTLVSKASNLPAIQTALKKAGALDSQVIEMGQGQKQSRFVAWTFQTKAQQQAWRQARWSKATAE